MHIFALHDDRHTFWYHADYDVVCTLSNMNYRRTGNLFEVQHFDVCQLHISTHTYSLFHSKHKFVSLGLTALFMWFTDDTDYIIPSFNWHKTRDKENRIPFICKNYTNIQLFFFWKLNKEKPYICFLIRIILELHSIQ